jgi:hypothetical protein
MAESPEPIRRFYADCTQYRCPLALEEPLDGLRPLQFWDVRVEIEPIERPTLVSRFADR